MTSQWSFPFVVPITPKSGLNNVYLYVLMSFCKPKATKKATGLTLTQQLSFRS